MKKILLNGVMGAIWYLFCVCIFLLFAFNTHAVVFNPNLHVNITASPVITSWTNDSPGYDTLTTSSGQISALINTAGTAESCHSNSAVVVLGNTYFIAVTVTNTSGAYPTISGTNGFPTTVLTSGLNKISWIPTGNSVVLTLSNATAASNALTFNYGQIAAGSQLLTNGGSAVWTNGSPGFDTLIIDTDYSTIISAVNTTGNTEYCTSNSITITSGVYYILEVYEHYISGQHITISGTAGFPTTTLTSGWNYIPWVSTSTSIVFTLTTTAASSSGIGYPGTPPCKPVLYAMNNNTASLEAARVAAVAAGKDVYVPNGVFYITSQLYGGAIGPFVSTRIVGQSQIGSILIAPPANSMWTAGMSDITTRNISLAENNQGFVGQNITFDSVTIDYISPSGSPYVLYLGGQKSGQRYYIRHCNFTGSGIYTEILLQDYTDAVIDDVNILTGTTPLTGAVHNIWVMPGMGANTLIRNPKITYGVTGIFAGTNRQYMIKNIVVDHPIITGITEEAIGFDGFGNNAGLCPVIANGALSSVSNDTNGRLVIGLNNFVYYGTGANQIWTVSAYTTANPNYPLTNFYFTLGQGTGMEGTIAKIYAYDTVANTVTLDCFISASSVTVTGDGGIQAGFFNIEIKNPEISNSGTGISAYLNFFNSRIEGGTIIGCGNGLNLDGGLMLSTYQTLAWNNVVTGLNVIHCDNTNFSSHVEVDGAVNFDSIYGGHHQYNNKFINSTVLGGRINMKSQGNLVNGENSLLGTTTTVVP